MKNFVIYQTDHDMRYNYIGISAIVDPIHINALQQKGIVCMSYTIGLLNQMIKHLTKLNGYETVFIDDYGYEITYQLKLNVKYNEQGYDKFKEEVAELERVEENEED